MISLLADILVGIARPRVRLGILQEVRGAAGQRHYADAQVYCLSANLYKGDPSGRLLHFVDFIWRLRCLPYSAWAAANLAELACHVTNMVELPTKYSL